jgi:predicted lipoprotein with Yx(FWY)xxD motif
MRRIKFLAAAAVGAAVVAPGVAAVAAPATSSTPTLKLMMTNKGKLLSSNGFVLYRFTHDGKGSKNTCVKIPGCSSTWPGLTTSGTPMAGPGVNKSLIGTTKLPNGKKQVTYAGHPIYRYAFGTKGSTSYVGVSEFGGNWYGVNAKGRAVK